MERTDGRIGQSAMGNRKSEIASRANARPAEITLASTSPRRRAMLRAAGLRFRVEAPGVDEQPRRGESPVAFAHRAALDKARAVAERMKASARLRVVVGCDTIVVLGRRILGKPRDAAEARRMLKVLSGRTHRVISGLVVLAETAPGRWRARSRVVSTAVEFRRLEAQEIEAYVRGGDPMDKAGAYGIQEGAFHMVRSVRGSYTNIVGLPMAELLEILDASVRRCVGLRLPSPFGRMPPENARRHYSE